jgi:hypothetical protein
MYPIVRFLLFCTLVMVVPPSVRCQAEGWEVHPFGREPITGCLLVGVNDSMLIVKNAAGDMSVSVDSIALLRNIHVTSFWTGAGYGALAGGALGAVIGYATYSEPEHRPGEWFHLNFGPGLNAAAGGVVGLLVGGLVGGSIAVSSSKPEEVVLSNRTHQHRVLILGSLVKRFGESGY